MKYKASLIIAFMVVWTSVMNFTSVSAASGITPKLVFNKNIFLSGEKVTMSVQLSGIKGSVKTNSTNFYVEYDGDTFELENGDAKKDIKDGYIKLTTRFDVGTGAKKKISVMYVDMYEETPLQEGKDVFSVNFKVKKNATEGAKLFTLLPVKMLDMDFNMHVINNDKAYSNSVEVGSTPHVKVIVNNQIVNFDVPPQIQNGRTMVPFRKIFEALGASVEWEPTARTVTGIRKDTKVVLRIDNTAATVNDVGKKLDVAPTIKDGRTLVPARFISESLGAKVDWDGDTGTVAIALD